MDKETLSRLKQDAQETLDNIDLGNLTKDSFVLAGASVAMLDYISTEEKKEHTEVRQINDPLPESTINEDMDDMNAATVNFWCSIDAYEITHTASDRATMLENLQNLLGLYEKMIIELRLKVRDPESIKTLKQFYTNISNRI